MLAIEISTIGIHAETCADLGQLAQLLTGSAEADAQQKPAAGQGGFAGASVKLRAGLQARIEREDRSVLNEISTATLNAIADAFDRIGEGERPDDFLDVPIYAGTDSAEHSFAALERLTQAEGGGRSVYERLGELRHMSNPIDMLRLLSTNPTYHASKHIGSHGGGYPVRAMSLSGLCAFEDAVAYLSSANTSETARCGAAIVIAAGNMRGFDALVAFGKLGLLHTAEQNGTGIRPSWGSAALLLTRRRSPDRPRGLADVLGARSFYHPQAYVPVDTWRQMFADVRARFGTPDHVVCYANGAPQVEQAEEAALDADFPNVRRHAYKGLYGYTGKANNLLDIAAILVDPRIGPGETVLINGAGFSFGIGYICLRKTAPSPTHAQHKG